MPYSNSHNTCHITIERSAFSNNNAVVGGAIYIINIADAILTFQTVTMESNRAQRNGGAVALDSFGTINACQSRFFLITQLYTKVERFLV